MERFNSVVANYYPDATPETLFVANSFQQLNMLGFGRNKTIACMGTCRDSSTRSLQHHLSEEWGDFPILEMDGCLIPASALASLINAQPHADSNYLFIVLGQIGIGTTGWAQLKKLQRECMVYHANWYEQLDVTDDLTSLRHQLAPYLLESNPSLIELTFHAHNAMCDGLQNWIDANLPPDANYAVVSGIQLLGGSESLIWPGVGYAVVDGKRHLIEPDLVDVY